MKIKCNIKREGTTTVSHAGMRFDFVPNEHGDAVCDIANPGAVQFFLETLGGNMYEKYQEPEEGTESEAAAEPESEPEPEPESGQEPETPEADLSGVELEHQGGGWYDVFVNDVKINDKAIRRDEVAELVANHKG